MKALWRELAKLQKSFEVRNGLWKMASNRLETSDSRNPPVAGSPQVDRTAMTKKSRKGPVRPREVKSCSDLDANMSQFMISEVKDLLKKPRFC